MCLLFYLVSVGVLWRLLPPSSTRTNTLFPYPTLFRSRRRASPPRRAAPPRRPVPPRARLRRRPQLTRSSMTTSRTLVAVVAVGIAALALSGCGPRVDVAGTHTLNVTSTHDARTVLSEEAGRGPRSDEPKSKHQSTMAISY